MAHPSPFDAATPTIPGLDRSLARLDPWHAGQAGVRSAVTKASKGLLQSRQRYSKSGMPTFYAVANAAWAMSV
jgi:hypothetical protein